MEKSLYTVESTINVTFPNYSSLSHSQMTFGYIENIHNNIVDDFVNGHYRYLFDLNDNYKTLNYESVFEVIFEVHRDEEYEFQSFTFRRGINTRYAEILVDEGLPSEDQHVDKNKLIQLIDMAIEDFCSFLKMIDKNYSYSQIERG